ncbi:ubiquitin-conjugating enzyme/RWD-like protein [Talaromyces proteolyticus]|uniref:Ubiquitin-conjugating enzyme/RWD-like protein n=1 Tax=Talaromyces proteolyticus TaxID=1131652 RepID=A0AAD4KQZ3_9EURO|nr:ubiquitin-conjugating enzyme/RWD-like protein [Talaromyces proteolyticus]KAH8697370.1 ubiquitin-conjugating enzyme/RWD-like protein [Talaromyces proteolyticus]
MVSKLRRLIADHADLHNSDLPPNYLFPEADSQTSDDLSQLTVLLAGPHGTPYSAGLWRLHLKIPDDYPASPPKAAFKTRIWHPNVEESTGAVCVDTLKRDWESKLTLRDILVTISCLLIHPNPDSALNSTAGSLLQDDYNEFARQAKLMTSIHALVPGNMTRSVLEAKRRGEDPEMLSRLENEQQQAAHLVQETKKTNLVMKKAAPATSVETLAQNPDDNMLSDSEDYMDDYKENDPSLSPEPVTNIPSSRRSTQEKRPLSVIPTAPLQDADVVMYDSASDDENVSDGMTASERNIAANTSNTTSPSSSLQNSMSPPARQAPQKSLAWDTSNSSSSYAIYEDEQGEPAANLNRRVSYGKENLVDGFFSTKGSSSSPFTSLPAASLVMKSPHPKNPFTNSPHTHPVAATGPFEPRKVTKPAPGSGVRRGLAAMKGKPRIGLRRL